MSKQATTKYRPSLTQFQIEHIIRLCKAEASTASTGLLGVLAPFKAKIDNAALTAAYTTKPVLSLEDKLGFEVSGTSSMTKEQHWESCYNKWLDNPEECTAVQITAANEHRYLHNLMTPEEQAKFEAGSV